MSLDGEKTSTPGRPGVGVFTPLALESPDGFPRGLYIAFERFYDDAVSGPRVLDGAAPQNASLGRDFPSELAEKPRFPDSRVAKDQDRPAFAELARPMKSCRERLDRLGPPMKSAKPTVSVLKHHFWPRTNCSSLNVGAFEGPLPGA